MGNFNWDCFLNQHLTIINYYQPNPHSFGHYTRWVLSVFTIICWHYSWKIQERTFLLLNPTWPPLKISAWSSLVSSHSNLFNIYRSKGINWGTFSNVAPPIIDSLRSLGLVCCSICGMLNDLLFTFWMTALGLHCLAWEVEQKWWRHCFDLAQKIHFVHACEKNMQKWSICRIKWEIWVIGLIYNSCKYIQILPEWM